VGIQHVYSGAQECVSSSRSRMSCHSLASMDYSSLENRFDAHEDYDAEMEAEEEKKGRMFFAPASCTKAGAINVNACVQKGVHYGTIIFSYTIILIFVYASFTVEH
jgi:hypothetical protein